MEDSLSPRTLSRQSIPSTRYGHEFATSPKDIDEAATKHEALGRNVLKENVPGENVQGAGVAYPRKRKQAEDDFRLETPASRKKEQVDDDFLLEPRDSRKRLRSDKHTYQSKKDSSQVTTADLQMQVDCLSRSHATLQEMLFQLAAKVNVYEGYVNNRINLLAKKQESLDQRLTPPMQPASTNSFPF